MKPPTDKLVAAVRYEGIVEDENGDLIDGCVEKLKELQESGRYIILVSPKAQSTIGLRVLMDAVMFGGIPYDEVWASPGCPEADEWYDNNAQTL